MILPGAGGEVFGSALVRKASYVVLPREVNVVLKSNWSYLERKVLYLFQPREVNVVHGPVLQERYLELHV